MYGGLFIAGSILARPLGMTSVEFGVIVIHRWFLTPSTLDISNALDCSLYRSFSFASGVCAFITRYSDTTVLTLSLIVSMFFYSKKKIPSYFI